MINVKTAKTFLKAVVTKNAPMYVQFALSKTCNLKCKMCSAVESRKDEMELNLEEIKKIAEVLEKMQVALLILTGGEPFLRKDLIDVVKLFTEKGIEVRLQTNGLFITKEKIKALLDVGVREVTISLDTLNPQKQDLITQKRGSFEKIINALYLLSKYFPRKGNMTGVNTVVSRMNIDDVIDVVKFVTEIGFYSSLIPVHLASQDNSFIVRADVDRFRFRKDDFDKIDNVYDQLIRMKKEGYHVHNTYRFLKESPDFLKYNKTYWNCDSPDLYFSISPSGKFLPCVDINTSVSMLEDDFMDKYAHSYRKEFKERVKSCSGCMYACYPEISYFCRKPSVFFERLWQGVKINRYVRENNYNISEFLAIAEKYNS